jgi:hypothetical protein
MFGRLHKLTSEFCCAKALPYGKRCEQNKRFSQVESYWALLQQLHSLYPNSIVFGDEICSDRRSPEAELSLAIVFLIMVFYFHAVYA